MVQEDGPTNEILEAVVDKMPEASATEMLQHVLDFTKEVVNLSEMTWDMFLSD